MAKLAVWVSIMLVLLVALSESSKYDFSPFCCTQYQENPIPVKFLKYYRIQEVIDHCNIKAIIFKTWRNKLVCADPDRKWVKIAQESEERKERSSKRRRKNNKRNKDKC
uniref:C-C motif chemokine n=1 Tax=Sander lucioperca TaxID=283035 RepID=A0A8C9X719_SANLU